MEITMMIEPAHLLMRAREMAQSAGIDNVAFDRDMLVMCGVRYVVEQCACGDTECGGVRLRRASRGGGLQ
jgi:hypothetical protein